MAIAVRREMKMMNTMMMKDDDDDDDNDIDNDGMPLMITMTSRLHVV